MKAIKTYIRTKSGRLKEKLVYVSKSDYDKIKSGEMDESAVMDVLRKYVKPEDGEKLDGWGEAEMKVVNILIYLAFELNSVNYCCIYTLTYNLC